MRIVVSIIIFVLIIGLLIFLHEFGHYFAAKRNGIGVTEFAIGMGPKLFSWHRKETLFSVRLIPSALEISKAESSGCAAMYSSTSCSFVPLPAGLPFLFLQDPSGYRVSRILLMIFMCISCERPFRLFSLI